MKIQSYLGVLCQSNFPQHGKLGSWCRAHEVAELELRLKMLLNVVKDSLEIQEQNLAGKFDHAANYTYYIRMKHAINECEES